MSHASQAFAAVPALCFSQSIIHWQCVETTSLITSQHIGVCCSNDSYPLRNCTSRGGTAAKQRAVRAHVLPQCKTISQVLVSTLINPAHVCYHSCAASKALQLQGCSRLSSHIFSSTFH
jgi:hypothetical protein